MKLSQKAVKSLKMPQKVSTTPKNTPALRARGLHTRSRWSSVISKRNQTNTFELMAFFWHGNSASVRLQNPPKAFKTLQKPWKHFERDPTLDVPLVSDSHDDRFLQTAQISLKRCRFPYISLKRLKLLMNVPDFLKTLMISLKRLRSLINVPDFRRFLKMSNDVGPNASKTLKKA